MRILVLGAGATGGYFGGRLAAAGGDVTFLVRAQRAAQLADRGLVVVSPFGDIRQPVATVAAGDPGGPYDLVLLTCKSYGLAAAMETIAPAIGVATRILPLLNGFAHLDSLDSRFGLARVLGGLCHIAATLAGEGEIRHLNRVHRITFGPRGGGSDAVCAALAALFDRTPVEARHSDNVMQRMWDKFVLVTPLAAMTCLMRASVGRIVAADEGAALMLECLAECAATAAAAGFPTPPATLEQAKATLVEPGSALTASMLRDVERGGPVEADHIVGDMLRRARAAGIAAPVLRVAYAHLQAYEAGRGG